MDPHCSILQFRISTAPEDRHVPGRSRTDERPCARFKLEASVRMQTGRLLGKGGVRPVDWEQAFHHPSPRACDQRRRLIVVRPCRAGPTITGWASVAILKGWRRILCWWSIMAEQHLPYHELA